MLKVFISATTADLQEARRHVMELVLKNGCHPIVEEGFEAEANSVATRRTIKLKLRAADAVIHIVGFHYGGEPGNQEDRDDRKSWTQIEYHEAKALGKKILVCLAEKKYYTSGIPDEIGSKKEVHKKRKLQKEYYEAFQHSNGWHYSFSTIPELANPVANFLAKLRASREKLVVERGLRLLFIGAQKGTSAGGYADLDLRGQLRDLKRSIARSQIFRRLKVESLFDAVPLEIIAKISKTKPDILHISGVQENGCIKLHDKNGELAAFNADRMADLIADSNDGSLRLVVLDTCYSMQQAKKLTANGVPYAIGISDAIADDVASDFYSGFYNAIANKNALLNALKIASNLILGTIYNNRERLARMERDILEMPFDENLHLPRLSVARGLDADMESFF